MPNKFDHCRVVKKATSIITKSIDDVSTIAADKA